MHTPFQHHPLATLINHLPPIGLTTRPLSKAVSRFAMKAFYMSVRSTTPIASRIATASLGHAHHIVAETLPLHSISSTRGPASLIKSYFSVSVQHEKTVTSTSGSRRHHVQSSRKHLDWACIICYCQMSEYVRCSSGWK